MCECEREYVRECVFKSMNMRVCEYACMYISVSVCVNVAECESAHT